ncbi:MAG: DUF5054 domain-containing protein [Caldilineaceae bacterium]|nr:DUF5054 domain-containing protein [Caldilineaceae bacterium]
MTTVSKVHLIFKTHLDLGFTDYAANVLRQYFEEFIPQALTTAETLRQREDGMRFVWTTGSWLIYEFLEQSAPAERRRMEAAIAAGDIVWHGLPFTFHSELVDPDLFRFGLGLSQRLDQRFGRKTIAAKMTDVPGHTRGIVPMLAEAGIRFLHIGVNEASTPPDVPPTFRWRDEASGADITVMYQHTYGASATVPNLDEALTFAHTNDNHGPQTPAQVEAVYAHLRQEFPSAEIRAATLDDFAHALDRVRADLPVITGEIGDSWIHGAGSDPLKMGRYRALCRLRRDWIAQAETEAEQIALDKFSRILLCVPEHTWGMDEKTHLDDYSHYSRPQFEEFKGSERAQRFAASWAEQRAYVDTAIDALGDTVFTREARQALAQLVPAEPDLTGYADVTTHSHPFETTHFRLDFDEDSGAITSLVAKADGSTWATPSQPVGWLRYQSFNAADYARFLDQYLARRPDWSIPDFSKPGLETAKGESRFWQPVCVAILHSADNIGDYFALKFTSPPEAVQRYGCPARFTLSLTLPHTAPEIAFDLRWFDKAANRQPEAIWFSFAPPIANPYGWKLHKLGAWIDPLDVVSRGNRTLHAIDSSVTYVGDNRSFIIESLDAPLVAPGAPTLLNFHNAHPSPGGGMHFNLYNNVWGTNFPMWYADDALFRFQWRREIPRE